MPSLTHELNEFQEKARTRPEIYDVRICEDKFRLFANCHKQVFSIFFFCFITVESLSSAFNNSTAEIQWIFFRERAVVEWTVKNVVGQINILWGFLGSCQQTKAEKSEFRSLIVSR